MNIERRPIEKLEEDVTCFYCLMTRDEMIEGGRESMINTKCCNRNICEVCYNHPVVKEESTEDHICDGESALTPRNIFSTKKLRAGQKYQTTGWLPGRRLFSSLYAVATDRGAISAIATAFIHGALPFMVLGVGSLYLATKLMNKTD
jgi:hypothetical protein